MQLIDASLAAGPLGHDLLRENVHGAVRYMDFLDFVHCRGVQQRQALDQLAARQGEQAASRDLADCVARTTDALQKPRDAPRRAQLAYEVHGADIDAQFQRGRGDKHLETPALKALLGLAPMFPGHAAVVRGDGVLAQPFAQLARGPFAQPPRVDEHQGRIVLAHEFREPVVQLRPDLQRHHGMQRRTGQFQRQVPIARGPCIDNRAIVLPRPEQEPGHAVHGTLRGRHADSPQRPACQHLQALKAEGQMGASLAPCKRMQFIQDHRAGRAQAAPCPLPM